MASVDPWEVAKVFMSALGDKMSHVKNAESTDLSSLLNVLDGLTNVTETDLKNLFFLRSELCGDVETRSTF